jgi:P27 family predicted phage terminase small subunit
MSITSVIIGGDGEPEEPEWRLVYENEDDLAIAHGEWGRVVREMREAQILSVVNGSAIRRLCDFRVQYERAARHVAENGAVLPPKTKRSKHANWNPWWSVMRQADEAIRYLETELGISPLRRKRAGKVTKRDKVARASDAYLKKAAG